MSRLFDTKRREAVGQLARDELYHKNPAKIVLDNKTDLYDCAVNHIGVDAALTYLEFGVAHGDSIVYFMKNFTSPEARFFGFDSFEGLPEAWQQHPQFAFDRQGLAPTVRDQRVSFVKGWFQNTIPPFFRQQPLPGTPVLVHYDADLYSSTLFAMTMVWPYVGDYFFIMDDFLSDDAIALHDFVSSYPVDVEFLAQAGRTGHGTAVPSWVFGHVKTVDFSPTRSG